LSRSITASTSCARPTREGRHQHATAPIHHAPHRLAEALLLQATRGAFGFGIGPGRRFQNEHINRLLRIVAARDDGLRPHVRVARVEDALTAAVFFVRQQHAG